MNIEQSEEYRKAVIASAKEWVMEEHPIGSQMEIIVIADHYGVDLPLYFKHFRYSNEPNHVCATGCHKWILAKLEKLANEIKKQEKIA